MKKKFIFLFALGLIPITSLCMEEKPNKEKTSTQKIYLDEEQREKVFRRGLEHYNKKDYNMAFKQIKMAADNDQIDAQYYLSKMYLAGKGCKKNFSKAMEYCSLAFNGGEQEAGVLWFKIVTEFIKESAKGDGQNPLQLLLDPSALNAASEEEEEEEEEGKKSPAKNNKKDEAWKSMYS